MEKELWEHRNAALRELEQKYKTDKPVFGAMYITSFGMLIDCSLFPNGHADISAWLHGQGLEIDYRPGEASRLLYERGWLRLNTKVGYVEQSDWEITASQRRHCRNFRERRGNVNVGSDYRGYCRQPV